jgi:hypothetical protein
VRLVLQELLRERERERERERWSLSGPERLHIKMEGRFDSISNGLIKISDFNLGY